MVLCFEGVLTSVTIVVDTSIKLFCRRGFKYLILQDPVLTLGLIREIIGADNKHLFEPETVIL